MFPPYLAAAVSAKILQRCAREIPFAPAKR
jgi:hypothetical protein